MDSPLVSTVIPTFNRRTLVCRAVDSALAQSYAAQEIIVIDDGSTDATERTLLERYGQKIRYVWQANAGVSSARNRGVMEARGEYIALLDSDDAWQFDKLEKQVAFLQARPDYGMVLTDVRRVDSECRGIDTFQRRQVIARDGNVLSQILMNPALVPASALIRRDAWQRLGGFDESLRTAEDIEFHLRFAASFNIGVIEEALTFAMRGHAGLSEDSASESDYVRVVERFVEAHATSIPAAVRTRARFATYARNARSAMLSKRISRGFRYSVKAVACVRRASELITVARLFYPFARSAGAAVIDAIGARKAMHRSTTSP